MKTSSCSINAKVWRVFVIALLWASLPLSASAVDLIVNGATQTISSGNYGTVVVKNTGSLTVDGSLAAETLILATAGTLNVSGNLIAQTATIDGTVNIAGNVISSNLTVQAGTMTVTGTSNTSLATTINGQLVSLGNWTMDDLAVTSNGVFNVYPYSDTPGSGTLFVHANTIRVEKGGLIYGTGAGNDPRGQGQDWYSSATGGSSEVARGGRGFWNSSGDGVVAPFGFAYAYDAPMGGAAGRSSGLNYGGGGILIEAEQSLAVSGDIIANGNDGPGFQFGGGAGGCILLRSPSVILNGHLSANGGNGGNYGGGGGGGCIKVFYGNSTLGSLASKTSALGGNAGGYLNTQPGQAGTVYRDFVPRVKSIISPLNGAAVTNGLFTFKFVTEDLSQSLDGRIDTNTPRIELSRDGFRTIAYVFDQDVAVSGWNKPIYYSGDTVIYTPPSSIQPGVYQWRLTIRDGSLYSRYTAPTTIGVETNIPGAFSLSVAFMTPTVVINGDPGHYRIDWRNSFDPTNAWNVLTTITTTSNPAFYLDLSGAGQPLRFYRAALLP